jgi:hypothetical protein
MLQDPYFCCSLSDILLPIPEEIVTQYPPFILPNQHEAEIWSNALLEPDDIIELRLIPSLRTQEQFAPLRFCSWKTIRQHRLNVFPLASKIGLQAGKLITLNSGSDLTWWGTWSKAEKKWMDLQGIPGIPLSIYAAPNPRLATGETKNNGVLLARSLWCDFDHITEVEVKQRLKTSGLPLPTLIVRSGGGLHTYWRLLEPLVDLEIWSQAQKYLIGILGSDPAIHDPARIMRLPGFTNPKTIPGNPCQILECQTENRYALKDMVEIKRRALPASRQTVVKPTHVAIKVNRNESALARASAYASQFEAPEKNRNTALFRFGCSLIEKFDLGKDDLAVVLNQVNARSQDSLEQDEVEGIAAKAIKHILAKAKPIGTLLSPAISERYELPVVPSIQLAEWRRQMVDARLSSLAMDDTIYFDGSMTGVGKNTADIELMKSTKSSVTYLPTHEACRELALRLRKEGLEAEAYPRMDANTCAIFGDEKNPGLARLAMGAGVSVGEAVCSRCDYSPHCTFQQQRERARSAKHLVATHDRGGCSDLADAMNRKVVFVHEEASKILRRTRKVSSAQWGKGEGSVDDLKTILDLCNTALRVAQSWSDPTAEAFVESMKRAAHTMIGLLQAPIQQNEPVVTKIASKTSPTKTNHDILLFKAMQRSGIWPHGGVMRLLLAYITGELETLCLVLERKKAGKEFLIRRTLTATWKVILPQGPTYWFEDATGDPELISRLTERRVKDMTPKGNLDFVRKPTQIAEMDVTQSTSGSKVRSLVRGLLAEHPEKKKVGIITHLSHLKDLRKLEPIFHRRIQKMEHYRSGQDRASNSWLTCDMILVLGTPRVPPEAIRDRLIESGMISAAHEDPKFGELSWTTKDSSGIEQQFKGTGYGHPDWMRAYRQIVRDNIIQAVGRGRGVTDQAVDVLVVTNEPLGIPVDYRPAPSLIADPAGSILEAVSIISPNYIHLANLTDTGLSSSSLTRQIKILTEVGLIVRKTKRGPIKLADHFC